MATSQAETARAGPRLSEEEFAALYRERYEELRLRLEAEPGVRHDPRERPGEDNANAGQRLSMAFRTASRSESFSPPSWAGVSVIASATDDGGSWG